MNRLLATAVATLVFSVSWVGDASADPGWASADTVRVLVVYHSMTGNTKAMAEAVAEGARSVPGAVVTLKSVDEVEKADLVEADALLIGSPTWWGTIATPVKQFIDDSISHFWAENVLDGEDTAAKMRGLRAVGVPYTDEDIEGAKQVVQGKTEMQATIAYLQSLGVQLRMRR